MNQKNKVAVLEEEKINSSYLINQNDQSSRGIQLVDQQIINEGSNDLDPAQALSHLHQVEANWKITNQVVTPFDSNRLIQTLNIPNRPGEFITVNKIKQNVQNKVSVQALQEHQLLLLCKYCKKDLCPNKIVQNKDEIAIDHQCDYPNCEGNVKKQTLDQFTEAAYYYCQYCKLKNQLFEICTQCYTNHFVAQSLLNKTQNQNLYESVQFSFKHNGQNNKSENQTTKTVLKDDFQKIEPLIETPNNTENYILIGLWKENNFIEQQPEQEPHIIVDSSDESEISQQNKKNYICYKQLRVDNPAVIFKFGNNNLQDFLFVSDDDQELFYFTKINQQYTFNLVDLEELIRFQNPSELDYEIDVCQMPTIENLNAICQQEVQILLNQYFEQQEKLKSSAPRLLGDILSIGVYNSDKIDKQEKAKQNQINVFNFVNVKTWQVQFKINEANLIVKMIQNKETKLIEQICYINQYLIKFVKYPQPEKDSISSTNNNKKNEAQFILPESPFLKSLNSKKYASAAIVLHKSNTRITIIQSEENWKTFDLVSGSKNAIEILLHHETKDAVFCYDKNDDQLYLVSNLKQEEKQNQIICTMDLIDLNQVDDIFETNCQKLNFQYSEQSTINLQQKKFMPFQKLPGNQFQSQLLFIDQVTNQTNLLQLTAQITQENSIRPWLLPKFEYIVEYPIVAYLTPHPKRNKIMLCNLSRNQCQKKLHLDLNFICFVESGQQTASKDINIYFLANSQSTYSGLNEINLYQLNLDPWQSMQAEDIKLSSFRWKINLGIHQSDQIKKAQLLSISNLNGQQFCLLIQFDDNISVQYSDHPNKVEYLLNDEDDDSTMAPIFLTRGLLNICYFTQRKPGEGDQLLCCRYTKAISHVEVNLIRAIKYKILQISVDHQIQPSKNEKKLSEQYQILVLDSSYTLSQFVCKNEQISEENNNLMLGINKTWDLQGLNMKRFIRALDLYPWQNCVLTSTTLVCARTALREDQSKQQTNKLEYKSCIYSTETANFKVCDFLGLANDIESSQNSNESTYQNVEQIPYIGKQISVIKERDVSYFLTSQSPSQRRIDFMSYPQQSSLKCNILVLKKLILVTTDDKYFVFDQKLLLLRSIELGCAEIINESCPKSRFILVKDTKKNKLVYHYDSNNKRCNFQINKEEQKQSFEDFKANISDYETQFNQIITIKTTYFEKRAYEIAYLTTKTQEKEKHDEDNDIWEKMQQLQIAVIKRKDRDLFILNQGKIPRIALGPKFENIVTKNYLVMSFQDQIWQIRREDIKELDTKNKRPILHYTVNIKKILLCQIFDGINTVDNDLKLSYLSSDDINTLCNAKKIKNKQKNQNYKKAKSWDCLTQNAFQISFKDKAIIWDLQNDGEIYSLYNIEDFNKLDSFVKTGFKYYVLTNGEDKVEMIKHCKFLTTNHNCTLVSIPDTSEDYSICFRLYSAWEVFQMINIQDQIQKNDQSIEYQLVISSNLYSCNFYGETFFSIFYKYPDLLQWAYLHIQEMDLDSEYSFQDNIMIRKIFYTICLPFRELKPHTMFVKNPFLKSFILKEDQWKENRKIKMFNKPRFSKYPSMSVLYQEHIFVKDSKSQSKRIKKNHGLNQHTLTQFLIQTDNQTFEKLLQLMILSNEVSLRTLIQQFKDFKNVFNLQSKLFNEFMQRAFIETPMTSRVTKLRWNQEDSMVVFKSDTAQLEENQIKSKFAQTIEEQRSYLQKIKKMFEKKKSDRFRSVQVSIIEVSWLNDNVAQFYKFLSQSPPNLYENALIKTLLVQQNYTRQIIAYVFIEYITYMITCLYYFIEIIPLNTSTEELAQPSNWDTILLRIIIFILTVYLLYIEVVQMIFYRFNYFSEAWNYGNLISYILNSAIIISHSTAIEEINLILIKWTQIAIVIIWFMFFYWMRLFPQMAFYVKLINQTIYDILQFLIFYIMIIFMFASGTYVLQQYNLNISYDTNQPLNTLVTQELASSQFGSDLTTQYLLGIGDYGVWDFSNFQASTSSSLVWMYFVLSTFLTNVVFLNMVVSIMSDTFNKIMEHRERNALEQQTHIYADFINTLKKNAKVNNSKYLYFAVPVQHEAESQGEQWEGGYNQISKRLDNLQKNHKINFKRQFRSTRIESANVRSQIYVLRDQQKKIFNGLHQMHAFSKHSQELVKFQSPVPTDQTMLLPITVGAPQSRQQVNNVKNSRKDQVKESKNVFSSQEAKPITLNQNFKEIDQSNNQPKMLSKVNNFVHSDQDQQLQLIKDLIEDVQTKLSSQINPKLDQIQIQIQTQDAAMKELKTQISKITETQKDIAQQQEQK